MLRPVGIVGLVPEDKMVVVFFPALLGGPLDLWQLVINKFGNLGPFVFFSGATECPQQFFFLEFREVVT